MLYGGTWDGFFFRIDPDTEKVTDMGTPVPDTRRVGALAAGKDGTICGVVGGIFPNMPVTADVAFGSAHLVSYDPRGDNVEDLGLIQDEDTEAWAGHKKICATGHSMAVADDGALYIGETDRRPGLYVGVRR